MYSESLMSSQLFLKQQIIDKNIVSNKQLDNIIKQIKELSRIKKDLDNIDLQNIINSSSQSEATQIKHTKSENQEHSQQLQLWEKLKQLKFRDIALQNNSKEKYDEYLKNNKGKQCVFRFPPEPNGYLHIGHAKSMRANFESARQLNGECYIRFDDSNPATENQEFVESILENVKWMGYTPQKITYCSDYFDQLFEFAVQLIKQGDAYVCEQSQEEMSQFRQNKAPSPYRDRKIEESLSLFYQMKQGLYNNQKYSLRVKIDHENQNPTLRDPVIYRILHLPHFRTGKQWCIYPLYDFVHGICDSLQYITYSLCTLEFEIRRDLYYWFLDRLNLYKPIVWEFSRLNIGYNVVSKRKLNFLINNKIMNGWDDPRLVTLNGLKRRGKAIKTICVIEPVELIINNVREDWQQEVEYGAEFKLTMRKEIYIERQDIQIEKENKDEDFYGIKFNKQVCLKYFGVIECTKINLENDKIISVEANLITCDLEARKKIKGQLHWLPKEHSTQIEVRLFDDPFLQENVNNLKQEELINQFNPNSLKILPNSLLLNNNKNKFEEEKVYQFDRLGYFCLDQKDSTQEKYVFNRISSLYQSISSQSARQNLK